MKSVRYPNMAAGHSDHFQTPEEAIYPLIPYLKPNTRIWEPSCGKGHLLATLRKFGFSSIGTDVLDDGRSSFFDFPLHPISYDVLITNPPYSIKTAWLRRCYEIGKPFALLLPLTALEGVERQGMYSHYGIEILVPDKRFNFLCPIKPKSSSWFMTAWFTWGLNIGSPLTFVKVVKP